MWKDTDRDNEECKSSINKRRENNKIECDMMLFEPICEEDEAQWF